MNPTLILTILKTIWRMGLDDVVKAAVTRSDNKLDDTIFELVNSLLGQGADKKEAK